MTPELERLLAEARARPRMTAAEREEQTRNFAAGNVGLENKRVTRSVVDKAAQSPRRDRVRASLAWALDEYASTLSKLSK